MNLLQIINAALGELGLPQQTTIIGSRDPTAVQMLNLANREGNELWRARDWTFLQTEFIINCETPITKTGDVTENSTVVTNIVGGTSDLQAGAYAVQGIGMPGAERLVTIDSSTQVTLGMESTETALATTLTFARDTYNLPTDFDHYITNTWWDRTNHWMLVGPQSPQFDQWQRSGIVTTGPRLRWRQIGQQPTAFRLWPPPTSTTVPDALVFEYIPNTWIITAASPATYISSFAADTDTPLFNPQMMILGIKWRFYQAKGFSYGALQQEHQDFVNREMGRDGGMPDLNMTRRRFPWLISSANVQDGNFPG